MAVEMSAIERLKTEPMNIGQWIIVAICIAVMALDGYDILSIAFAAPGITQEWGLSKSVLGIVLSLELAGMAGGSIFLGSVADSHGRRPTMIGGLVILTAGMLSAGLAPNVYVLAVARLFTGVGIGCMLATATATCSDYCNNKNRSLAVTLVAGGVPVGIYLGATLLGPLLKQYDWRITFYLGAAFSFFFIPVAYFLVPETISFLDRKRPEGALERIQKIMRRYGHTPPESLGPVTEQKIVATGLKSLFGPDLAVVTSILSFAYFGNIMTYYYFVKWIPTIVTDIGYTASEATSIVGIISLGGVVGSISIGLGSRLAPIRVLMVTNLLLAATGVALFPYFMESLASMKWVGFLAGGFLFAAISGFFGLFADSFPSSVLASGAGVVTGIGRGGAVLGPMLPGFLFAAGLPVFNIAIIMAAGSFLAGLTVIFLRRDRVV
jgi:MFS transporter, AAHS family, vanillate permease